MSIRGELVTETLEYDGGRKVTVYMPPEPPEAVLFAGDGQQAPPAGRPRPRPAGCYAPAATRTRCRDEAVGELLPSASRRNPWLFSG